MEEYTEEKMISAEKVMDWLFHNFVELKRDGDYDWGQPYIESVFDTYEDMMDDFCKNMGIE